MKALVLVSALALAATSCSAAARPSAASAIPTAFANQHVRWASCGAGFQCGDVSVPLSYEKPTLGSLTLKVIRLPARDGAHRIGSLVLNPGGPGGSGVEFARGEARLFGTALQKQFDIVGFDPRGVGSSAPIRCLTGKELDTYLATDSDPRTAAQVSELDQVSRGFATGCEKNSGRLLPYVGTETAARDMDVIRGALGDRALTYYGASYGTYLGAYYADEYPTHVRALVLDGAIDPTLSESDLNTEQAKGFETALRSFATDCVSRAGCPLGTTVDGALNQVSALIASSQVKPLASTLGDGRTVDSALVVLGIATALYSKQAWPTLRQAFAQALSTQRDGTILLSLGDQLVERNADGTYSNQTESNMAINCVDKPYPRSLSDFQKQADAARAVAPRFGPFVTWGSLPCAYWSYHNDTKPKALKAEGAAPILVVGTTRDPATPYQWAKNLAGQLSSGILLSLDGDGHTAYLQGNTCITSAVEHYLLTQTPPTKGTLCR